LGKNLADLAFAGLASCLIEKMEGRDFANKNRHCTGRSYMKIVQGTSGHITDLEKGAPKRKKNNV
jgi:hypothetical protein